MISSVQRTEKLSKKLFNFSAVRPIKNPEVYYDTSSLRTKD